MNRHLSSALRWLVLLVALGVLYQWQTRNLLETGNQVPDTHLPLLSGGSSPLTEEGKPTLVYFFAPWCSICAASIGNLEALESDELVIRRVAMDYASLEDVSDFVRDNEVSGDVLIGHEGLKQQFRVLGYPTYYLLDANQRVVASDMGYSTSMGLKVRKALAL
ncbi:TlpA family protein disulfide reductase [Bowmanella yangjiangensis]|uniref:TlpA family protein disulfide reductase n=1 Tax=Bowmanella yangjiangensis TaxID=2811230 RepID=A0ABS3CWQ8_9ALTE|nr:TlpA disulfide reductase family protein [Bowmanella yangjiangensis]MBN7821558.1 TlpA family protein disulfide reductase [Bowmanella yangjiangensis]